MSPFFQSLNEYLGTLANHEGLNVEWKPQMDALVRYGRWITSNWKLWIGRRIGRIVRIPENFVEELLMHLANSLYAQSYFLILVNYK